MAIASSSVSDDGSTLTIAGDPGANTVTVGASGAGKLRVSDSTAGAQAGAGCVQVDSSTVECAQASKMAVTLGDGDDSFSSGSVASADNVDGGAGNDQLDAGQGDDTIQGGAGNDAITANDGEVDTIGCGDGSDSVTADTGDTVDAASCETVKRVPPSGGAGGSGNGDAVTLSRVPHRLAIKTFLKKGIAFRAAFATDCHAVTVLFVPKSTAKRLGLAKKDFLIASDISDVAAGDYNARLKPKKAAKKLAKLKRVPTLLGVTCTDVGGHQSLDFAKLTLTG